MTPYPYQPAKGMHVGHMTRYPEELGEFLAEKLADRVDAALEVVPEGTT